MAMSQVPLAFAAAAPAVVGTSVAPSTAVPDNCHTIILYNRGTNPCLWGYGAAPTALTEGSTGFRLPAGASQTLPIGTLIVRGSLDPAGSLARGLVFDLPAAGATDVDISYLCTLGLE